MIDAPWRSNSTGSYSLSVEKLPQRRRRTPIDTEWVKHALRTWKAWIMHNRLATQHFISLHLPSPPFAFPSGLAARAIEMEKEQKKWAINKESDVKAATGFDFGRHPLHPMPCLGHLTGGTLRFAAPEDGLPIGRPKGLPHRRVEKIATAETLELAR